MELQPIAYTQAGPEHSPTVPTFVAKTGLGRGIPQGIWGPTTVRWQTRSGVASAYRGSSPMVVRIPDVNGINYAAVRGLLAGFMGADPVGCRLGAVLDTVCRAVILQALCCARRCNLSCCKESASWWLGCRSDSVQAECCAWVTYAAWVFCTVA